MSKSILDEYIKRRENGSAVYNPRQTPYGQGMSYRQPAAPQMQQPANQSGQVPVYRPNQWSRPAMVKAPTVESDLNATPQTNTGGSNVLTWDDQIDIEIQAAAKKVLDVSNRKFQYSPYESPIYSIMRQEYLKEADLAQGRATAAAAQNAGGFGSSFAVMAGEEARRQVMEGFHDQEDELYGAAQAEFEAERASAFDRYLQLRELKEYEKLKAEEEAKAASGVSEDVAEASALLLSGNFTEYSEGTMRALLETTGQYDEATINAALEQARKAFRSGVSDSASNVADISTAVTYKGELDAALRNKTMTVQEYDKAIRTNSQKIMAEVNKGLERLEDMDHTALGYTDEAWNKMDDEDKKLAIFDSVGQMVKAGAVTHSDYYKMLYDDLQGEFDSEDFQKSKYQTRELVDMAIVIQDLYNNGYLLEDSYKDLVYKNLMPQIENDKTFKTILSYSEDYDYESNPEKAIKNMDHNHVIPDIGIYSIEEQGMLLTFAREYLKKRPPTTNKPEKKGAT